MNLTGSKTGTSALLWQIPFKILSDYSVRSTILVIGVAESVTELIGEHQSIERALVQIPRMSPAKTGLIVRYGLDRLQMSIGEKAINEISGYSQGLPTRLLALHTARAAIARKSTELNADDVDAGINAALDHWQESIKSSYYRATKSQQPNNIYRELACALARADDPHFTAAQACTVRFDQRCPQRPSPPD